MACCLTEPNHYLKQCWLITSKVQWQLSEGNFIGDTSAINYSNLRRHYLTAISFKSPTWPYECPTPDLFFFGSSWYSKMSELQPLKYQGPGIKVTRWPRDIDLWRVIFKRFYYWDPVWTCIPIYRPYISVFVSSRYSTNLRSYSHFSFKVTWWSLDLALSSWIVFILAIVFRYVYCRDFIMVFSLLDKILFLELAHGEAHS